MLDHKSDFLKYEDFKSRYKVKTTFLTYYGVVSATAKLKKSFQDQVTMNSNQPLVAKSYYRLQAFAKKLTNKSLKESLQHLLKATQNG